jgi:hypothetical protein
MTADLGRAEVVNWEAKLKLDWNADRGGQIHLDGEMDFPRDLPMQEVYESLHSTAMQVGGVVDSTTTDDSMQIQVSTQYGALEYILIADNPSDTVQKIKSISHRDDVSRTRNIQELERMGETASKLKQAIRDGDIEWTIEKDNDRKNILNMGEGDE